MPGTKTMLPAAPAFRRILSKLGGKAATGTALALECFFGCLPRINLLKHLRQRPNNVKYFFGDPATLFHRHSEGVRLARKVIGHKHAFSNRASSAYLEVRSLNLGTIQALLVLTQVSPSQPTLAPVLRGRWSCPSEFAGLPLAAGAWGRTAAEVVLRPVAPFNRQESFGSSALLPLLEPFSHFLSVRVFDLLVNLEGGLGVFNGLLALAQFVQRQAHVPERVAFAPPVADLAGDG